VTGSKNAPAHEAKQNVSHVTDIPVDAGEIVGAAWDALRTALRIPDADRQEGGRYTTSSGRLFDFIGERVRRAARDGAVEELIPFREAAAAVERDVRVGDNGLAPNYFSKVLGRWKAGEGAAKGAAVDHTKRGETDYLLLPSPPYRVLFEIRGPKETDPTQQLERPASVRWSVEQDGVPIVLSRLVRDPVTSPTIKETRTTAEPLSINREEQDATGRSSNDAFNPIANPALFAAGTEDVARGVKRIDQASADPAVRKTTREISRLLRTLTRLGLALLILAIPYAAFPQVRHEVNAIIKTAIDFWIRLTTDSGSGITVHHFSGPLVYKVDASWLAQGRPLEVSLASSWPVDDEQRFGNLQQAVKLAGGDPGPVFARLQWRGAVKGAVVQDAISGPGLVHLLAIPSPALTSTSLTYVMTSTEFDLKTGKAQSAYTTSVDDPHFGLKDIRRGERVVVITITMIPKALLAPSQRSVSADCEHVELLLTTDYDGRIVAFAPPPTKSGIQITF